MTAITIHTHVDAPVDRAWAAWTHADDLARWWWPMFDDTVYELDVRAGGAYRIETADGGIGVRGDYLEVVEPERLVLSWIWLADGVDDGATDTVTVTFAPEGDGTLVRVVHETAEAGAAAFEQGWRDCLARLALT